MREASYYKEVVDKMNLDESKLVWDKVKVEIEKLIERSAERGNYHCFLTPKNGLSGIDFRFKSYVWNFLIKKLIEKGYNARLRLMPENGKHVYGIMVSWD